MDSTVPDETNLIQIPTGILLQSLEFLSGDNIQISGFYWQRFGPDVPDDFVRGLVFPEAIRDAYKADRGVPLHRRRCGDGRLVLRDDDPRAL